MPTKMKLRDDQERVVMDGMTFYIPDGHVPLQTFHNALLLYVPSGTEGEAGNFTAVFEQSHHPRWERKYYSTFGRIQSWVTKEVEASGGIKKLDEEKERLLIAVWEPDNPNRDRHIGKWRFGRLTRNHIGRWARALIVLDGEDEEQECSWHSSFDKIYVCDDPEHVEELNEAEDAIREAIEYRDKLKKRLLSRINPMSRRAQVVGLAKKQMRRIKARLRRAAA